MGPDAPGLPERIPPHPVQSACPLRQTLNEQAQQRMETLISQMQAAEGVTEDLKATNPMAWAQRMNNIQARAEEIVREELIFV